MKRRAWIGLGCALLLAGCVSDRRTGEIGAALAAVRADPALLLREDSSAELCRAALGDARIVFEERTLVALGYSLGKKWFRYGGRFGDEAELTGRLLRRPELTEEGLRALAPLLLSFDEKAVPQFLDRPEAPREVLEAYAEKERGGDHCWAVPLGGALRRFAARRLRTRSDVASVTPDPMLEKLLVARTVPEELTMDRPTDGWRLRPDFVFEREMTADDGRPVVLEVVEPRDASADWRRQVEPRAVCVKFPTAAARDAELRRLSPAYRMAGDLLPPGFPICPDYRKGVRYAVTCTEGDGAFGLRLERQGSRW